VLVLAQPGCRAPEVEDAVLDRMVHPTASHRWEDELLYSLGAERLAVRLPSPGGPSENPAVVEADFNGRVGGIVAIETEIEGADSGGLSLVWRMESPEGVVEGRSDALLQHSPGGERRRVRFDVGANPAWRGEVGRLRVFADKRIRPALVSRGLWAVRRIAPVPDLEERLESTWRVQVGIESRLARLGWPGEPLQWTVRVPSSGARLRFGLAVPAGDYGDRRHRVIGEGRGRRVELYSELWRPVGLDPSWQEAILDLAPFAGAEVRMTFETMVEGDDGSPPAPSFWAEPVLLGSRLDLPPNLVLISIDTLRADHLSLDGYARPTSPRLDAWAEREAVVFENAISQAPSTLPSHVSMLTGIEAYRHGVHHAPAPDGLNTLAERLGRAGFTTVAVTGGGYLDPYYRLDQGFGTYRSWRWGVEREREFPENLSWVRARLENRPPEPFFLFLHTYEVHPPFRARAEGWGRWRSDPPPAPLVWLAPAESEAKHGFLYEPPPEFEIRGNEGEGDRRLSPSEAIDRYDSSIAFVDAGLGELIDQLRRTGLKNRTVIVVTSDHGELFGEHGLAGHGSLFEPVVRVPLLIAIPEGRRGAARVESQVRLIDVVPTLLELAGVEPDPELDGESLVPLLKARPAPQRRLAWTYAANSNYGLALRSTDQRAWWLNNTAWSPLEGRRRAFERTPDGEEERPHPYESERDLSVFSSMARILSDEIPGLVLDLKASDGAGVHGRLCGDVVEGPTRVKSGGGGSWTLEANGCIHFGIEPGGIGRLIFEQPSGHSLWIEVADGPRVNLDQALDAARRLGPQTLVESAPGWPDAWNGAATGLATLRIEFRRGSAPGHVEAESKAVVEQLRSLGYLD